MSGRGSVSKYGTAGGVRWRFRFDGPPNADGSRRQVQGAGFLTKAAAWAAHDKARDRFVGVTDPSEGTFSAYLEDWISHRSRVGDLKPSTVASYRRLIAQIGEVGMIRLDRLTSSDLDRLYTRHLSAGGRTGEGRAPRTTRFLHTVIRKALKDAQRKGLIGTNPADGATPPAARLTRPPEPNVWSIEEGRRFLAADWLPEYRRIIWLAGLHTGLRRGELAGLRWDDLEDDSVTIRRSRTTADHEVVEVAPKSERSRRTIHLSEGVLGELRRWRTSQARLYLEVGLGRPEYVFTDAELQPWHPDALSRAWSRDADRAVSAGVVTERMRLHDLRHWHATALIGAGVDIRIVADRLGHADAGFTLERYGHSDADRDRAAAQALEALR